MKEDGTTVKCTLCGSPITPIGCSHARMGFTDDGWILLSPEQQADAFWEWTRQRGGSATTNVVATPSFLEGIRMMASRDRLRDKKETE